MANRQRVVTLNSLPNGEWLFAWQVEGSIELQQKCTTVAKIEAEFPNYCAAVRECLDDFNPAVPLPDLLIVAGYSYGETVMKRKRFQVYRHFAWVNGWHERTKLPAALEQAIKDTWSEVDEHYVGFLPSDD